MKSTPASHKLKELAESYMRKELAINPEFQRGAVWTVRQQRGLIDSILRGFVLPIFYVQVSRTRNLFTESESITASLVDGQQRLNAIAEFMRGKFALDNPTELTSRLSLFIHPGEKPPWAGKRFDELTSQDRERFLSHPLQVVQMEEEATNEVRDLFVRLQAGTPLSAQEKRDAWPGNFTLFVIRHAGKDRHPLSNPHRFFDYVKHVGGKGSDDDDGIYVDRRSNTRKFFAGLAMTYLIRQESKVDFVDLKASNIDAFYLNKSNLALDNEAAVALLRLLDLVADLPDVHRFQGNKLKFQWAFHLLLLADSMNSGGYVESSWRPRLVEVFEKFRADCANAAKLFKQGERSAHYTEFVQPLSGSGSDTADTIRRRHQFLVREILQVLQPRSRDPLRLFGPLEREIMWYRQEGRCAHPDCRKPTALDEMEAHHIDEHSTGGATHLTNGVLVCRSCHQNRAEMKRLAPVFKQQVALPFGEDLAGDADEVSTESDKRQLRVEIAWRALGKERDAEIIWESNDSETLAKFCARMLEEFGEEAVAWLTARPVTRFPISNEPEAAFRNPVSGKSYSYRKIGNTAYFVCTHSSREEKARRLEGWISGLPEPLDAAISVSISTEPTT